MLILISTFLLHYLLHVTNVSNTTYVYLVTWYIIYMCLARDCVFWHNIYLDVKRNDENQYYMFLTRDGVCTHYMYLTRDVTIYAKMYTTCNEAYQVLHVPNAWRCTPIRPVTSTMYVPCACTHNVTKGSNLYQNIHHM